MPIDVPPTRLPMVWTPKTGSRARHIWPRLGWDCAMGILDDKTRRILSDGKIFDAMHRLADHQSTEHGYKVEVKIPAKDGGHPTVKQVIIRKVTR